MARKRPSAPVAAAVAVVVLCTALGVAGTWLALQPGGPGFGEMWFVAVYAPFVLMGSVVIARRPRNPVGWLLATSGFGAYAGLFVEQYAIRAVVLAPGSLPHGPVFAWVTTWVWNLTLLGVLFTVLLFPTGRAASPRWRPAVWLLGLILLFVSVVFAFGPVVDTSTRTPNPLAIEALRPVALWVDGSDWVFLLMFGLAIASVIARFRSSRGIERQQLKWAAGGCAVSGVLTAVSYFSPVDIVSDLAWVTGLGAIPVAFAIAILRYRLYEIDVLINRALVYGAMSALLIATYVLAVLALSALLRPVTTGNDIAVALSTLAVVALFQPVRSRMQRFVDSRFYRARYDAARTVDAFSGRLRDQVDLDALRGELVGVVHDTVRPAHASLWLRR